MMVSSSATGRAGTPERGEADEGARPGAAASSRDRQLAAAARRTRRARGRSRARAGERGREPRPLVATRAANEPLRGGGSTVTGRRRARARSGTGCGEDERERRRPVGPGAPIASSDGVDVLGGAEPVAERLGAAGEQLGDATSSSRRSVSTSWTAAIASTRSTESRAPAGGRPSRAAPRAAGGATRRRSAGCS